jgi:uncharacterized protein (TIGR02145 family)
MRRILIVINFIILIGCKKSDDGTVEVVPLAPTELKATIVSKDQINLSWKDNSTNENGYKIERKIDFGVFTELGSTATDITTFTDKTVSLNTNYTYRVYSFNKVGKSIQYSNEVSIKTMNLPTISLISVKVNHFSVQDVRYEFTIPSDGGSPITAKGVVWSTSSNPTVELSTKTSDGIGTQSIVKVKDGFPLGTKLYMRAYATNSVGTTYSNEIVFTTLNIPELTTNAIIFVTSGHAKLGGTVTSDGGISVTSRGVVWSTNRNPTIALTTKTSDGKYTGGFQSVITGLASDTKYYVRAYATNNVGTSYGNEISFTTLPPLPGGLVYGSNGRIWMNRNLGAWRVAVQRVDHGAVGDLYQWGRGTDGHQNMESRSTANKSIQDSPGHSLFITGIASDWRIPKNDNLWQGVNGVNNPCPAGFRLPTMNEWKEEITSWNGVHYDVAFSSPLKITTGFLRSADGSLDAGGAGGYWTSSVDGGGAIILSFMNNSQFTTSPRASGFCVRCIKD